MPDVRRHTGRKGRDFGGIYNKIGAESGKTSENLSYNFTRGLYMNKSGQEKSCPAGLSRLFRTDITDKSQLLKKSRRTIARRDL